MKFENLNTISCCEQKDVMCSYVIKLDDIMFHKLEQLPNVAVCLIDLNNKYKINNEVYFVNHHNKIIGTAKLTDTISAPKDIIWQEINHKSYLTHHQFLEMYQNTDLATISIIYEFVAIVDGEQLPIENEDYHNQVGLVVVKND